MGRELLSLTAGSRHSSVWRKLLSKEKDFNLPNLKLSHLDLYNVYLLFVSNCFSYLQNPSSINS